MIKRHLILICVILLVVTNIFSITIKNEDLVYDENIQTVLLHPPGDQLSPPVIRLNSADRLRLSFDDLSPESYQFKFTFIHCTDDWEISDLGQMDYIDGFFEEDIVNYQFSLNAIPPYVHYNVSFPTRDMKIKLSGNYILKVFLDDINDENVILTHRFYVVEPVVSVEVKVPYYPKNLEFVRNKQQIDLTLKTPDIFSSEAEQRVNVTIQQNGRWDNIKEKIKPTSVMLNQLNFDFREGIVFEGGNQFRNFDMKSFWYQSMYIREIINDPDGYVVKLHTDYSKAKKPYSVVEDISGKKLIKARSGQDSSTEGEYAWVEFWLKQPKINDADIYILGALNSWQLDEKSKLRYDSRFNMYKGRLFLKQGYYNYLYVVVPKGKKRGSVAVIEGDHWETKNQYTVYVYYRERVPEYDRLVGFYNFNSFDASTE
jgi:type 9 secretion system plug protein